MWKKNIRAKLELKPEFFCLCDCFHYKLLRPLNYSDVLQSSVNKEINFVGDTYTREFKTKLL